MCGSDETRDGNAATRVLSSRRGYYGSGYSRMLAA